MPREFDISEHHYRSRKLNAFEQLFVIKRLAGTVRAVLTPEALGAIAQRVKVIEGKLQIQDADLSDGLQFIGIFSEAVSALKDEDLEYVINTCCRAVQRQQETNWHPLIVNGVHMYQDLSAANLLVISYNVLIEDLSGFFNELLSTLGKGQQE